MATYAAIRDFLESRTPPEREGDRTSPPFPVSIGKAWDFPRAVCAVREGKAAPVPFGELEGRVCGETISLYPPGIPLIVPGERFSKEVLDYLEYSRRGLVEVVAADPSLATVRVLE